uniref:Uncharacterized protein n=1 Tax=Heterorhabditis bacteriophora TaxID=37862 RepID=A0A1I7W5Z3_HETBA
MIFFSVFDPILFEYIFIKILIKKKTKHNRCFCNKAKMIGYMASQRPRQQTELWNRKYLEIPNTNGRQSVYLSRGFIPPMYARTETRPDSKFATYPASNSNTFARRKSQVNTHNTIYYKQI